MESGTMKTREDFFYNVYLIFSNCELFNLGFAGPSFNEKPF